MLHEWRAWVRTAGADVTSVARVVRVPWLPGIAPALRGRGLVAVDVAMLGEPAAAAAPARPLRRLDPGGRHGRAGRARGAARALVPRDGGPSAIGAHVLLRELPPAALDAFLGAAGPGSRSELVSAELRHLGDEQFAVAGIGVAGDAEAGAADPDRARRAASAGSCPGDRTP